MDIWGIGPRMAISGSISFIATLIIGYRPKHFGYWFAPMSIATVLGIALVIVGVYFWLDSVRLIKARFKSGVLITVDDLGYQQGFIL